MWLYNCFVLYVVVLLGSCSPFSSRELYRIQLLPGRDLVLNARDNPCAELRKYCISINTTSHHCVQKHQYTVQKEILRFSDFMYQLEVDAGLFIECEEKDLVPEYNSLGFSDFYQEMLHILQVAPPGDLEALHLFDLRRTEVKMSVPEQISLYSKGITLHPNSSFLINQLGLTLSQQGLSNVAARLYSNAVKINIWPHLLQRPEWNYYPRLISKPWHNTNDHFFAKTLEAGYSIIRSELLANLNRDQISMSDDITNKAAVFEENMWKILYLKHPNADNYTKYANFFPETLKILNDCNVSFIEVKFSSLQPGTHIKPHTGPSNNRLRIHLGLVHTGGARIRVGREWRTWTEGSVLIFDSSWEHEVYHNGTDIRIVLILDIWNAEAK